MPQYAVASDVFSRVRGLIGDSATAFSSSTIPTDTEVEAWMDEAVNILHECLQSVGIDPIPQTSAYAIGFLGELETRYAEGRVRRVIGGYGGDQNNRDGQDQIDSFFAMCDDIKAKRVFYQEGFSPSTAISSGGDWINNAQGPDALTTDDTAPRFTRKMKL